MSKVLSTYEKPLQISDYQYSNFSPTALFNILFNDEFFDVNYQHQVVNIQ